MICACHACVMLYRCVSSVCPYTYVKRDTNCRQQDEGSKWNTGEKWKMNKRSRHCWLQPSSLILLNGGGLDQSCVAIQRSPWRRWSFVVQTMDRWSGGGRAGGCAAFRRLWHICNELQLAELCCCASKVQYISMRHFAEKGDKITAAVASHLPGHQAQTKPYFLVNLWWGRADWWLTRGGLCCWMFFTLWSWGRIPTSNQGSVSGFSGFAMHLLRQSLSSIHKGTSHDA